MKTNPFLNTTILRCIILQILSIFSFSAAVNAELSTTPQTSIKGISASYQIIDPSPLGPGTPPTFAKVFNPDNIGPGSISTLQFSITSIDDAADNITFTDVLPAGMVIAIPTSAISTCDGEITASSGGNSISFTGGRVAALATCTISVNVASSTLGTATNNTGDLTSSLGNSGIATDDLIVTAARPGFSMAFTPNTIAFGGRSRLTFTIDNSANTELAANLAFVNNLPSGMQIATPANATHDCIQGDFFPGTPFTGTPVSAAGGGSVISLSGFGPTANAVTAGSTCTVSVDVVGTNVGVLDNISNELTSTPTPLGGGSTSSGKASNTLNVSIDEVNLSMSFTDDPLPPGGIVTLEYTILNRDRSLLASNIGFTHDLDTALTGLTAIGLPLNDPCGLGSSLTGTSILTLTGASVGAAGSCVFSVALQIPAAAVPGNYGNTTSAMTSELGSQMLTSTAATDVLFVESAPQLTKTFLNNPIGSGGTTSLEFTITNTSTTSAASDIAFNDELTTFFPFPVSVVLPPTPDPPCGTGSAVALITLGEDRQGLSLTGGNLVASGSCTFSVDLNVPVGLSTGNYVNITEDITAIVDSETVTGNAATATLEVIAAPSLVKEFVNDPVIPGATVDLQFTLTHDETAPGDATAISFTDDLSATLAGLLATGLPMNDVCGASSVLSGTTQLTLSDGLLAPGASCTFTVTLDVPVNAIVGNHTNTTSSVSATASSIAVMESAASDDLNVAGLVLSKAFTDDPILPGATVTLEFTINNSSPISDATGILFFDNLSDVIPGLTAISLPANDFCGAGSTITGTTFLVMSGGNLLAGDTCTFAVTLQVPSGVASNTYNNTTSNLFATIEAQNLTLDSATDNLVVNSDLLMLTKSFTDDPVAPGANVTLEFTINNLDLNDQIIDIAFTDDLESVLPGMAAIGLPATNICGSGSSISGAGLLTFSGGTLAAGASCAFSVTLQVPADVSLGTIALNTTDTITGMLNSFAVNGGPAIDELRIDSLDFSKAFDGPAASNGSSVLSFTINNLDASQSLNNLQFTDDLEAMIPGLMATGLPLDDVCGVGSQLAGTSFLTLTAGNLLAAGSCSFDVTLQMPADVTPGDYINTTSDLRVEGLPTSIPATATLTVTNQAPDCSGATPSQATLWPPDLSFQAITLQGVSDPDGNPLTVSVTSIFQDENVDSTGDGAFVPDGQGIGSSTASVRAERIDPLNLSPVSSTRSSSQRRRSERRLSSGRLDSVSMGFATGRVYHITYNVDDGNGGSCDAEVLVSVPVVENGVALDEGSIFDSTAN